MEIKDVTVGQTVFVELRGDARRYKREDELIEEWEVMKVGRKYIQAKKKGCGCPITFEKIEYGYDAGQFVEKKNMSIKGCMSGYQHSLKKIYGQAVYLLSS